MPTRRRRHRSSRGCAARCRERQGVSKSTISNIWRSHNLKPHRTKTFMVSRDPRFLEKLTDVVGLYLNPAQQALVLCVDEKTQITSIGPHPAGVACEEGALRHDDSRLHAQWHHNAIRRAGEVLQGKVIGQCYERHRHQQFLRFLRHLDQEFPGTTSLHLVMDNYGTHNHPKVQAWLARHRRFIAHFVPTSSSWLNPVERWFGELTSKRIRRGSFGSVEDLKHAIVEFLEVWNEHPKPFVWTATVESILEKLARCPRPSSRSSPAVASHAPKELENNCPANSWTLVCPVAPVPQAPLGLDVRVHGMVNDAVVCPICTKKIPSLVAATCDVEYRKEH